MNEIEITDFAAKHILKLISAEADNDALRIEVKGGGCSGFQYEYSLTCLLYTSPSPRDTERSRMPSSA